MKKKGLLFALIGTVLLFCVVLSACSLITVNEERQANRVVATVAVDLADKYGNGVKVLGDDWDYTVSMDITRRELVVTVNYAINYYSQLYSYYGMTYNYDVETLLDSALKTLKSQKYNTICAMGELLVKSKDTGRFSAMYCNTEEYQEIYGKTLVPEGILTVGERYYAMGVINEQFTTQLESYIDEAEDEDRENEKSEANNTLSTLYDDGYFVSSVSIAYKNADGEYVDGLYATEVIDDAKDDTKDLDYTKVYAKVKLYNGKKSNDEKTQYVYVPIEETDLTLAEDEDAETTAKYTTAKIATISYSGRVYAEITEDDDDGYDVESFTSSEVSYTLVTPRSAYEESDEEESDMVADALRYITVSEWDDVANYTDEMKELATTIFNPSPSTYANSDEKDAYRQLRSNFSASNIGFIEEEPEKTDISAYNNYTYYNGLHYYYESQFDTEILNAVEYELGVAITAVDNAEIAEEYTLLVLQDKANYEYLTKEEQVTKFFETVKGGENGLDSVYYVPIDALTSVSYEINPTDKAYASLFTLDGDNNVVSYNTTYVTEENGKYTMKYAYDNGDGTYTINMIFVTHVLLSFDNVPGLADDYKQASSDYTDEQKMEIIKLFVKEIKTCPQLVDYLANYDEEKVYEVKDVFATDENGNLKYQTYDEAITAINTALEGTVGNFEDMLSAFITLTEIYDDDGGKLTDSGYLVSAGDMANGWYEDFTATALKMYFEMLVAGKNPTNFEQDGTTLADRVQDAYSDYGIHKMFISFAPLYNVSIDNINGIGIQTELDLDGTTRYDEIGEELIETKRSKAYTDWKASMTEEEVNKHSIDYEKNYKIVVDDLTD